MVAVLTGFSVLGFAILFTGNVNIVYFFAKADAFDEPHL